MPTNFHHGHEASTPQWGAAYDRPPSWRDHATCAGADTGPVFYPFDHNYALAAAYCANCPVRVQCLDDALATRDDHGYRGGHTPKERQRIRDHARRRRRLQLAPAPTEVSA